MRILTEADSNGLSVKKIAKHVYNACNSLFAPISYDSVYKVVVQDLLRTEKRGTYRINTENPLSSQLLLQFKAHEEEEKNTIETEKEMPLSLFDDVMSTHD